MVSDAAVLMSIRPTYADAILAGTKTVELRRRRPSFPTGTTVLVYSSSPDQHVSGIFRTGPVLAAPPDELWPLVEHRAGVTRAAFDAYFKGAECAYAIEVRDPQRVSPTRLPLRPPQSYLLLHATDARHQSLLALAAQVHTAPRPTHWLPLRVATGAASAALRAAAHITGLQSREGVIPPASAVA